jgi:hypothetical protein
MAMITTPRPWQILIAALVAAFVPVVAVTGYFAFVQSPGAILPVLTVSAIFCILYTLIVVFPILLLLDRILTFGPVVCILLGAFLAAAAPFLIVVTKGSVASAFVEASPFLLPGALAGYVFFVMQRLPSNPAFESGPPSAAAQRER